MMKLLFLLDYSVVKVLSLTHKPQIFSEVCKLIYIVFSAHYNDNTKKNMCQEIFKIKLWIKEPA